MAVVTSDLLAAVLTNFQTLFGNSFDAATSLQQWSRFTMVVPSSSKTESYEWLGTVPIMEDVTHQDLKLEGLLEFNQEISNLTFKAGIEVERNVLEDDRLGLVLPRVNQLGMEAARHPGQLIFNLFESNGNAYDGTSFFANTRTVGDSANIDNLGTATGTTVAAIQTDINTARLTMRQFQDDHGRVMNLLPDTIVIPPDLEQIMYQALNVNQAGNLDRQVIPNSADGIGGQGYTVIVNPFLTSATAWYMLHTQSGVGPFIFQDRTKPALEGVTDVNSESGVIRDRFFYSVRARYNVGYAEPRHAFKLA